MNGLFSSNPEMTRAMNYGVNLAGVPAGRAALALSPVMGQMAQQATGGLLSGLGVESPEAKKERALQAILGGINPQDANSLADASRKLMGMGLSAEAAKLMEEARKIAETGAKVYKDQASGVKDLEQAKVYAKEAAIKGYPARTTALIASGADEVTVAKSLAAELQIDEDAALAKIAKDKAETSATSQNAQSSRMQASAALQNAAVNKMKAAYDLGGGNSPQVVAYRTAKGELESVMNDPNTTPQQKALAQSNYKAAEEQLYGISKLNAAQEALVASGAKQASEALEGYVKDQQQTFELRNKAYSTLAKQQMFGNDGYKLIQGGAEVLKDWAANQDDETALYLAINELINSGVLNDMKKLGGGDSNEELKFVMKGYPQSEKANKEYMRKWLINFANGVDRQANFYSQLAETVYSADPKDMMKGGMFVHTTANRILKGQSKGVVDQVTQQSPQIQQQQGRVTSLPEGSTFYKKLPDGTELYKTPSGEVFKKRVE
jgi:hypothetical protein